ncbi:glycoside hydrolase TIM-barrel-like domain-containing protein [Limibaculum sp. M0105]|uniref:Glycoside hydrolase TIM-barrel-like domain-containing protein n=1 Tax=Thermohalobaculum xanthum TaxID=2753746 RepID=A0A8J7M3Z9_9RHOB|nr:phage tail protein [Thermohalobaculum xanthum]MBK0397695.1 glycoside hydrolase TIM-barrel-like domain-containing protein [Thermohalobaculum xanthum]
MRKSRAGSIASLPEAARRAFFEGISENALAAMPWLWEIWAHPDYQLAPEGGWRIWVIMGGRGAGKTRAGAEWVRAQVEGPTPQAPGRCRRVCLLGETIDQARAVMVEGESGILAVTPPDRRPTVNLSQGKLLWPNGAEAMIASAANPEALRGPQFDCAWSDETGCPAVDLGANAPNLFLDGRSSESALPFGSRGVRDEEMQRRFLQAKLGYWADAELNPVSELYDGAMIPAERVFVWTWDARPWPDFPVRESIWADGPAHRVGHWITGRVLSGSLADVVAEICAASGVTTIDVSALFGVVHGYLIERASTVREALQPLMTVYAFDAFESGGVLRFRMRGSASDAEIRPDGMADGAEAGRALEIVRDSRGAEPDLVRLFHVEAESDYRHSAVESRRAGTGQASVSETSLSLSLPRAIAQGVADRWLAESDGGRVRANFRLPPSALAVEPGDVLSIAESAGTRSWRVERLVQNSGLEIEAVRVERGLYMPGSAAGEPAEPPLSQPPGPVEAVFLNLPIADGTSRDHRPFVAVSAEPWAGDMALYQSRDGESQELVGRISRRARLGMTLEPLPPGDPGQWHRTSFAVALTDGAISSEPAARVLNGANLLAVEAFPDTWELIQIRDAVLEGPGVYRMGMLLRGLRGTEWLSATEIPAGRRVVVVDDALFEIPLSIDEVGLTREYRVGPARFGFANPSFSVLSGRATGVGLRPFAPAGLRIRRGAGGLDIRWHRRTRLGGDSWDLVEVPLGEASEQYRVRIHQGGVLLREASVTSPSFTYTNEMQAEDGRSGSIEVAVAQVSAVFGPGPERVIEIDG